MDKVYHFKGKSVASSHLKHLTDNQAGFYSEEEAVDTPPSAKPTEAKKSPLLSGFSLNNGEKETRNKNKYQWTIFETFTSSP